MLGEGELLLWTAMPIVSSYIIVLVNLKGHGETPVYCSLTDGVPTLKQDDEHFHQTQGQMAMTRVHIILLSGLHLTLL